MGRGKKAYNPLLYAPYQPIVDRAVMLEEGESFEVQVEGVSASMLEYRVRGLLECMRERGDNLKGELRIRRIEGGIRVRRVEREEIRLVISG